MFRNCALFALLFCSTSFADPKAEWDRFVGIVSELSVTETPIQEQLVERIRALHIDATACSEIREYWKSSTGLKLAGAARPIATLLRRAADDENLAKAYLEAGWEDLRQSLEMKFNAAASPETFEPWMLIPPEAEALEIATGNLNTRLAKMKSSLLWLKVRFFMYQSALSVTTIWWLAHHFPQYIPDGFWGMSQTAEITTVAGVILLKNIAMFNAWWPRFDLAAGRILIGRRYKALVDSISEAIRISPDEMVGPLLELAKAKEQQARILEDATLEAFFQNDKISQVREALVELALQSTEEGEIPRTIRTLESLKKDAPPGDIIATLAVQLEEAIASRDGLETKLRGIRRGYTIRNVALSLGLVGGSAGALYWFHPGLITAAKVLGGQVVALFGASRLIQYIWFTHPTDKLRERLAEEIEALTADFQDLLATDAKNTLRIVKSVALPNAKTHPFVREAALEAMSRSTDPLVAQAFRQLALMNVQRRGKSEDTEDLLGRYFKGYARCIDFLRDVVMKRNSENPKE